MRRALRVTLALALAAAAAGFSPFQAEQPDVRQGNERLAAGDAQAALPHYDAAERAAGPRAEIDYDRGIALLKQGKATEARDAFRRALDRGAGELSSRAAQNLGSALAAAGDREGAIGAYTEALRTDPGNEDARFNLEVLLRRKDEEQRKQNERQQPQQPQAQGQQGQKQQQGAEAQAREQGRKAPEPARPQQAQGTPAAEPKRAEPRPGKAERPKEGEEREGQPGEADTARLTREDAARILDAFRARERSMPLAGTERRRPRRDADADRDW